MQWQKLGLIWAPGNEADWARSHATLPVVQALSDDQWWIYISTRDAAGKSRIARLTVDASPLDDDRPPIVTAFDPTPVLSLGAPGSFDDSGVMPSWLVEYEDELRLYYIGWNVIGTVPYRLSIGMAVSRDGGHCFRRFSEGPLIDRSLREPFFATAPCVLQENDVWRMWYISCTGWEQVHDRWEPCYHVKYAESSDGTDWTITGRSCVEAIPQEAIGRPCVSRQGDAYTMLYSRRSIVDYRTDASRGYQLGYAESADGLLWRRLDANAGIDLAEAGWDSQMIEYCWRQQRGLNHYVLYNGNGFGRSGVGIAKLAEAV